MNSDYLFATKEGAQIVREFAQAMVDASADMDERTKRLTEILHNNEQGLGVHTDRIIELIEAVKSAEEKSRESIDVLPPAMKIVAQLIEDHAEK